jgi:hypothetical protein
MKLHPRFSLRTLVILLTLVCAYFGLWSVTEKYALRSESVVHLVTDGQWDPGEVEFQIREDGSPVPFVIWREEDPGPKSGYNRAIRYYLWFFGWEYQLPFEEEIQVPPGQGGFF